MTTHTSDEKLAGTDGYVYFSFVGSKGRTPKHEADNEGNDRERGQTDVYTFSDNTDIGEFQCVVIRLYFTILDGFYGWLIDEVFLQDTNYFPNQHVFTIGKLCWIILFGPYFRLRYK